MNIQLLEKHIKNFKEKHKKNPIELESAYKARLEAISYYRSFAKTKILNMSREELYQYLSKLWAMLIWGNKHYVVDKIIDDNGFENFKKELAEIVWGEKEISERWDIFRSKVKGLGPAMISEILCKTHPDKYAIWNRRAYVGLHYLQAERLPRYDYQVTGKVYKYLCDVTAQIAEELQKAGIKDTSLLAVDYFIWDEMQVEENLSKIFDTKPSKIEKIKASESEFIHNDIRDKLRDIGQWLGFEAKTEQKVAEGSKVDTIWEATIGNMGRVIYVFEVQTKGSIDSLMVNLLKSLNNPAVQGVVAVSDQAQIEKINKNTTALKELQGKLKLWNYEDVLKVHESLEFVNGSINKLKLVPEGFY